MENSHWIAVLGGIITTIATSFVLYFDDTRSNQRVNKRTFAFIGAIGGIITIVAAFCSTMDNNNKSNKNNNVIDSIKEQNKILIKENENLNIQLNKLSNLSFVV